jgi:hypothetical protein
MSDPGLVTSEPGLEISDLVSSLPIEHPASVTARAAEAIRLIDFFMAISFGDLRRPDDAAFSQFSTRPVFARPPVVSAR